MAEDADALVLRYGLQPHPEGGFFRETYRAPTSFARGGDGASRSLATSIFYLLRAGERSCLHRIRSDELWFHHAGDALTVFELVAPSAAASAGGEAGVKTTMVGSGPGSSHFHVVPAGTYFGSKLDLALGGKHGFSLVSCVVAPGFDFADWEMEDAAALRLAFPGEAAARVIDALAKDSAAP